MKAPPRWAATFPARQYDPLAGERRLAVAVLRRAVQDARLGDADAVAFLADWRGRVWGGVAGVRTGAQRGWWNRRTIEREGESDG